jgi:phospholipase/lecithinase/hemolysin
MGPRVLLAAVAAAALALSACASTPAGNAPAQTAAAAKAAKTWKRVYVFGDSYSDIGFGYLDGNGPTAVAYMSAALGQPVSHTKAANWQGKSLDFAVSGAQTGTGGSRDAKLGYGMGLQAREFATLVSQGKIRFDPDHTLFFIAGGLNDGRLTNEVTEANLTSIVEILKNAGAKHFRIAILPEKIPSFSRTGTRLNPTLAALPAKLTASLGVDAKTSRWGAYFDEVMENPAAYGITDTKSRCAERNIPGPEPEGCANPDQHYFYHEGHPSTAVHKVVGARLVEELATE